MSTTTQHGYLLLADISGYTSFVAGTELEHSHEILSDLLETIYTRIEKLMTIHRLEGDAIFAYTPERLVARSETLLEMIESTYIAFRDQQRSLTRATSCPCRACQKFPDLDLKFILHYGEYVLQQVRGITELVGSDVNLIHRLAKNHVTQATGWRAYLMITEPCLRRLDLTLEAVHEQTECYEHLGEIKTFNIDLHQRYEEIKATQRVIISEQEADLIFRVDFPTPPPITWEWLQDPRLRTRWNGNVHWYRGDRPRGRTGAGASNHCAHGNSVSTEVIVDWHPFDYSTIDSYENGKKTITETIRLELLPNGGTQVTELARFHLPLPRWLRRIVARQVILRQVKYDRLMAEAARLAGEEYDRSLQTE
jgi:uncharacterized protein YndB with AHSA1/START domain